MATSPALTQYLTLTANTVATLTIPAGASQLTIVNRDGQAEVFFTVDGTTPAIGAAGTYFLPALAGANTRIPAGTVNGVNVVKFISAGTPAVAVDPTSTYWNSGSAPAYITPMVTSLNGVTASANGSALDTVNGRDSVTMQVVATNTAPATTYSTQLQGSLDNVNWFNIGAALTDPTAGVFNVSVQGVVARYFRAVTSITGGTAVTVTAKILCVP